MGGTQTADSGCWTPAGAGHAPSTGRDIRVTVAMDEGWTAMHAWELISETRNGKEIANNLGGQAFRREWSECECVSYICKCGVDGARRDGMRRA